MAAPTNWRITDHAKEYISKGIIDLDAANKKMALFLAAAAIDVTKDLYGDLGSEHANANGYTTGGQAVTLTVAHVGSTTTITQSADVVWTAAGGSITARYAIIYIDATVDGVVKPILAYCILDSTPADVTATDGNTLTIKNPTLGVATLTGATS